MRRRQSILPVFCLYEDVLALPLPFVSAGLAKFLKLFRIIFCWLYGYNRFTEDFVGMFLFFYFFLTMCL